MNVVHLSSFDIGGANVAAIRISNAMQKSEINSSVLVREKRNVNSNVEAYVHNRSTYLIGRAVGVLSKSIRYHKMQFAPYGINISRHPLIVQSDVIVVHWINQFLSLKNLESLIKLDKPIIFVLHDMWLYTGGCHYDEDCGQYETGCKECSLYFNFTKPARQWRKKAEIFTSGANTAFVAPSSWMAAELQRNPCYSNLNVHIIKYPINIDRFQPVYGECKNNRLNKIRGTENKFRIVFGAVSISDKRKGMDLLMQAFAYLEVDKYELVAYGRKKGNNNFEVDFKYTDIGTVTTEESMVEILNSADVFVAPSRQENYANVVLEALSCGVPVVAFDIGGMSDLIIHKYNGYLAKHFDVNDLAEGIRYCADNRHQLGLNARRKVLEENEEQLIAGQYMDLITVLMKKKGEERANNYIAGR